MQRSDYFYFIDQLTQVIGAEERIEVEQRLADVEQSGLINDQEYLELLENDHPVIRIYGAGVLGRQKSKAGIAPLIEFYDKEKNPLVLSQLLNVFFHYDSGEFLDVILAKILLSPWKGLINKKTSSKQRVLRDLILTDSLKYIQKWGDNRIEKKIAIFLKHSDPLVRWNTLKSFDALNLKLNIIEVEKIAIDDSDRLVRELAAIIIEKRLRSAN
ncbi:MAG: hypothetical protein GY786_11470 [Proteobacteria bacterium]|nr:hypothetical protein [Pseudomonadota bacterium]